MMHYICTGGCRGISPKPKSCGAESCPKHGKPLNPCNCKDNEHDGAFDWLESNKYKKSANLS